MPCEADNSLGGGNQAEYRCPFVNVAFERILVMVKNSTIMSQRFPYMYTEGLFSRIFKVSLIFIHIKSYILPR